MFNPLTQEVYTETVESWSASFFALLSLLPRHPDIQKELALPTAAAEDGQTGPAAVSGGSGGVGGALGRRGGDAAQPNGGAAAGQQQQQADGAGGAAVREPAGLQAASSGASGSGGEAAGSGDGGDGSSADKALEIASALREHMQQQDGSEAQQGQQGGSAAAAGGQAGLEPLAGGRPRSGVASAIYWLTLAALGALAGRAWVLAWVQGVPCDVVWRHAACERSATACSLVRACLRCCHPPYLPPCCRCCAGCGLASYLWRQPRVRYQLSKLIGSSFSSRRRRGLIPL